MHSKEGEISNHNLTVSIGELPIETLQFWLLILLWVLFSSYGKDIRINKILFLRLCSGELAMQTFKKNDCLSGRSSSIPIKKYDASIFLSVSYKPKKMIIFLIYHYYPIKNTRTFFLSVFWVLTVQNLFFFVIWNIFRWKKNRNFIYIYQRNM